MIEHGSFALAAFTLHTRSIRTSHSQHSHTYINSYSYIRIRTAPTTQHAAPSSVTMCTTRSLITHHYSSSIIITRLDASACSPINEHAIIIASAPIAIGSTTSHDPPAPTQRGHGQLAFPLLHRFLFTAFTLFTSPYITCIVKYTACLHET